MKSIFSQISKSSLLNHAKRLAMAVVLLSFTAIASASKWSGTATMNVGVTNTGGGTVYVSTDKTATSGQMTATGSVHEDGPTSVDFFLFATPNSEDYSFAGWYEDATGD